MQFRYKRNSQVFGLAGMLVLILSATIVSGQPQDQGWLSKHRPKATPDNGWILVSSALSNIQQLDPALADTYFNNADTFVQSTTHPPSNQVPSGWAAIPNGHYTRYESCGGVTECVSLEDDLANGVVSFAVIPNLMFDDENWDKTPTAEQRNPALYMNDFVQLSHSKGFKTIMAPDQNLASPKNGITKYEDGETENWQTYLRLGLGTKAAASGTDGYHIMAQPFATHWCCNPEGNSQGSEADFYNFVVQAALQAKAVNPNLSMTVGLSTNPRYNSTPQALYQVTLDTNHAFRKPEQRHDSERGGGWGAANASDSIPPVGYWLNILGASPAPGIQYLEMLSGMVPFYPGVNGTLSTDFPTASTANTFALSQGVSISSVSSNIFPAGTVIPAGSYKFEPWTDGSTGSDVLSVDVGYCNPPSCSHPTSFFRGPRPSRTSEAGSPWTMEVVAGDIGIVNTFTTDSPTVLPPGGPYNIYVTVTVKSATGSFNLLYNSGTMSTNVALPRPSSLPARPNTTVLFAGEGDRLNQNQPLGDSSSLFNLNSEGAVLTLASARRFAAGQVIPAGAWEFQFWTDGTSDNHATLKLEFGYCTSSCTTKTPIINSDAGWNPTVAGGSSGAATAKGAFTTQSPTTLPPGGPYQLYFTMTVQNPGPLNLLYDSATTATNVATPFVISSPDDDRVHDGRGNDGNKSR